MSPMQILPLLLLASLGADAPVIQTPQEQDIERDIGYLASPRLEGRLTSKPGEQDATTWKPLLVSGC